MATAPISDTQPSSALVLPSPLSFSDTITDITPFIPIVLDLNSHNYYHWRHLFEIHLGRCSLMHHISGDVPPAPSDPHWVKDDLAIIQWLYTRISTELFNLVVTDGASARDIWAELRRLFQYNRDARVSALNTELCTITLGDCPVGVFCQRIKAIGDELRELGEVVVDRSLLHVLMGGLDDRFAQQAALIPLLRPLPTLAEARSMLQMEEQNQTRKAGVPRLFHATTRPAASAPAPTPAALSGSSSTQPPPGWRPSPNYKGKNPIYRPPQPRSSGASSSSSAPPPASSSGPAPTPTMPSSPWRPSHDPWTGLVQAWSMPWSAPSPYGAPPAYNVAWAPPGMRPQLGAPGLHGSRPPPHAYTAYAPLYQPSLPPSASSVYHLLGNGIFPSPLWRPLYFTLGSGAAGASRCITMGSGAAGASCCCLVLYTDRADLGPGCLSRDHEFSYHPRHSSSLSSLQPSLFPSITVGNGSSIPITCTGSTSLSPNLSLRDVLVAPALIKNLISVRKFTIDNLVSVEFDPLGVSVKDHRSKEVIARFNSSDDMYTVRGVA
ncbi:uncharacterized protein [Aegilops tauschii subsp. strangulata]|uniref:uncharacterized protein n=1 Tax=Aegilops tauschii subsp. strangulata TaxID=200361 RepID=UPI00098A2891|nr:flocculation protein FLO11-like [Aegilops tauschii subsp. strangulata]